jgi:pimeloyl-ACP methyl ester carboxylesterase
MKRKLLFVLWLALILTHRAWSNSWAIEAVDIGGIKQWIRVHGADSGHPVLLFLHGGPGSSSNYADPFLKDLQTKFIVVLWDQRECGYTAKLNASNEALTLERMEADALEMINYLRQRFLQDKIFLMGHSWGGFLGLQIASHHPELLRAYFAVSPMVHQTESERLSLESMRTIARSQNNQSELSELEQVQIPFENGDQLYFHRSWLAKMMGTRPPTKEYVRSWSLKWLALFNDASKINFFETAPEIKCPVYFFVGGKDYQTHFQLTKAYYDFLKADKKELFWFADSGHNLFLTEPTKFQEIVLHQVASLETP